MTVYELIVALAKYNPSSEVRITPSIDSGGDRIARVYGIDVQPIGQGRGVIIEREASEL